MSVAQGERRLVNHKNKQCKVLKFMGRKKYNLVAVPYFQARDNKSLEDGPGHRAQKRQYCEKEN